MKESRLRLGIREEIVYSGSGKALKQVSQERLWMPSPLEYSRLAWMGALSNLI